MRILVSGSTGLIGSPLVERLQSEGHKVVRLIRRGTAPGGSDMIEYDLEENTIDAGRLEHADAVIHLAGENVATGRWSSELKQEIYRSRVASTQLLAETIQGLEAKPKVFMCASAIGYYGGRGDEFVDEDSPVGDDFLARVCQDWEAAAESVADAGVRTVRMRIGVVLSPEGGALGKLLPPFRLGGGGVIGSGDQYMSWIDRTDLLNAMMHILHGEEIHGALNLVSPAPVTNRHFTKTLGTVLERPTVVPLPASIVKLTFGEMGESLLLSSIRAVPKRLLDSGFVFSYPDLYDALAHQLR